MRKWRHPSVLFMQSSLVFLFAFLQVCLFIVHSRVSELVDSLAQNSIWQDLFDFSVWFPVFSFVAIQIAVYGLLLFFVWFLTVANAALLRLSKNWEYFLGVVIVLCSFVMLWLLNAAYYPGSFFAEIGRAGHEIIAQKFIFASVSSLLVLVIIGAFLNGIIHRSYLKSGGFFLIIVMLNFSVWAIDTLKMNHPNLPGSLRAPNVILIGLDSLRPDYTSFFGSTISRTPNIDRFLASGVTFTKNYSPLARTFPSWVSILTGKHPKHSTARSNLTNPATILTYATLAQRLQEQGYESFFGLDDVDFADITKDYGFDHLIGPAKGAAKFVIAGLSDFPVHNLMLKLPTARFILPYTFSNRELGEAYDPADYLQLLRLGLSKRASNKPLFLAVHFCLPHWPFRFVRDRQREDLILPERYLSSVQEMDKQLGIFLEELKQYGLLENALVVVLSDHGVTLGLPNDRLIKDDYYRGSKDKRSMIQGWMLSSASGLFDFEHDFSIATSYGEATDVLSLKQNHALLSFHFFGRNLPAKKIDMRTTHLDIAPTILDILRLPPLPNVDGVSLLPYFSREHNETQHHQQDRSNPIFLETGHTVGALEADKIEVNQVVKQAVHAYRLNHKTGELVLTPKAFNSLIANKQRAILWGDWILANYPPQQAIKAKKNLKDRHGRITSRFGSDISGLIKIVKLPRYYVLVNLKTGLWTVDFDSDLAKTAPLQALLGQLKKFYGDELPM